MSISLELVNMDKLFRESSTVPIIINEFNIHSAADKERLNELICTMYEGDTLSMVPTCHCEKTFGAANVGMVCERCGVEVMPSTERPLESALWIAPPKGVSTLINPHFWSLLSAEMTRGGFNMLEWLCNPTYVMPNTPAAQNNAQIKKFMNLGITRGINYFHENFDTLVEVLHTNRLLGSDKRKNDLMREFIAHYRDCIFAQYLPIPSRQVFITEKTITSTYVDTTITAAVDAIYTITAIENSPLPNSPKVVQARTVKAISLLAEYYQLFVRERLSSKSNPKAGLARKHIFGSRLHFTFRGVISSLSDRHKYDELHMPWSMAVMLFKFHLFNKMMRRRIPMPEIYRIHTESISRYDPLIDELFDEILNESHIHGFPVLFNRNPTLVRGSIQCMRITQIKKDPKETSISFSVLALKAPNADFDGDALNGMLILDRRMYERMKALEPHTGVLDLDTPRTLSSNIQIPAPTVSTIANWVHTSL